MWLGASSRCLISQRKKDVYAPFVCKGQKLKRFTLRFTSCVAHRGWQAPLQVHPGASYTTIQLQLLVLCNLLPFPRRPQIPPSSLSPIPLIWPLCSWFRSVSSRSWTNRQICQEMQEGNRGLSERAGYLRGCPQETVSVSSTSYPKPETSRGWAGEFIRASCLVDTGERWEVWK